MANEFEESTRDLTLEGLRDLFDDDELWRTLVDQFIPIRIGEEPRPDIMLAYLVQESEKAIAYIKGRALVTTDLIVAFTDHTEKGTDNELIDSMTKEIKKLLPKLSELHIADVQLREILIEVLTSIQRAQPTYSFLFTILLHNVDELVFEYSFSKNQN